MKYWAFEEGSYWIYKEIHTGELDSSYVIENFGKEILSHESMSYDLEAIGYSYKRNGDTIDLQSYGHPLPIRTELIELNKTISTYLDQSTLFYPMDSVGQYGPREDSWSCYPTQRYFNRLMDTSIRM